MNIVLIGFGNMGKIHHRIISESSNAKLICVVDKKFKKDFEVIDDIIYSKDLNFEKLNTVIDAVIIASTTDSHYKIAKELISKNIPIFVEKPISANFNEVCEIIELAKSENSVLRCGLIELYNPIFTYIKNLDLKEIISIYIYRHSQKIGKDRKLENVILDLALHDFALIGLLFGNPNLNNSGSNFKYLNNSIESADLMYSFNNTNLFISSSRQSQIKIRTWEILTERKLYQIDLIQKCINIYEAGSISLPNKESIVSSKAKYESLSFLNHDETAKIQLDAFINNIKNKKIDLKHLEIVKYSHSTVNNIFQY